MSRRTRNSLGGWPGAFGLFRYTTRTGMSIGRFGIVLRSTGVMSCSMFRMCPWNAVDPFSSRITFMMGKALAMSISSISVSAGGSGDTANSSLGNGSIWLTADRAVIPWLLLISLTHCSQNGGFLCISYMLHQILSHSAVTASSGSPRACCNFRCCAR